MTPDHLRLGRIGHVVDLVALTTEGAQQIHAVGIALAERLAVAHPRHLRGAGFAVADRARNVGEVFRISGIGHVEDRGAVELFLIIERIVRRRILLARPVVAHIGDVSPTLPEDCRHIGGARLQVVVADLPHVQGFRRLAELGRVQPGLRRGRRAERKCSAHHGDTSKGAADCPVVTGHGDFLLEYVRLVEVISVLRRCAPRRSAPECACRC